MVRVRPGSHMANLLRLLSVSGEFPCSSLGILGDNRTLKAMVHKFETVQDIRLSSDNTILTSRLFQLSGKRGQRTIRLNKNALQILDEIHPYALDYYSESFPDRKFSSGQAHIGRNHRVGEALAMIMMSGIEMAPYALPKLQKESIRSTILESPSYYVARNIKKIYEAELNKTIFTRIVGLLFYPSGCYAVYNTRDAIMKWSGLGELKARQELTEIVRMNAGMNEVSSALLLGTSEDIALQTLTESDKSHRKSVRFDRIYHNLHFVPMDANGIDLIKMLTLPDWNEKLMRALFTPEMRPTGYAPIEFDAYWNEKYMFSHLDGDLARLIRFSEALALQSRPFEILCFPWQVDFLRGYLGDTVLLKQLEMPMVLKALGIE